MKTSLPRIHSISMKNGGAKVRVLNNDIPCTISRSLEREVSAILKKRHDTIAGYAIVAWSHDGGVSTSAHIIDGRVIKQFDIPNFVKNALIDYLSKE